LTTQQAFQPIGIFDSGVGGLTVFKALKSILPDESYVYLGDTARVPYGTKSKKIVTEYSIQNSQFLLSHGVKLIVVACNTASAFALSTLSQKFSVPVVGVIEPGVSAAIQASQNHKIAVIGTEGTISSQAYPQAISKCLDKAEVFCQATPLLVPIIEENMRQTEILHPVFEHYLSEIHQKNVDTLVLGCTHYPIIKNELNDYFQQKIQIVDSATAAANVVKELLLEKDLQNSNSKPNHKDRIFVTDAPERIQRIAEMILGGSVEVESVHL
jgi:glutamate racemase